jgi:hypothetical protein
MRIAQTTRLFEVDTFEPKVSAPSPGMDFLQVGESMNLRGRLDLHPSRGKYYRRHNSQGYRCFDITWHFRELTDFYAWFINCRIGSSKARTNRNCSYGLIGAKVDVSRRQIALSTLLASMIRSAVPGSLKNAEGNSVPLSS